jgi:hypothetical protein
MTDEILTRTEAKILLKTNKGRFDYLVASKKIYSKNIKGELYFLKSDLMKFSNRKKTENFQIFESSLNFNEHIRL